MVADTSVVSPSHRVAARGPRIRRAPEALASHTILLTALSTLALAACAKVGEDVFSHETAPFDEPIRAWVQAHHTPAGERFFLLLSRVGGPSVVVPLSVAIGIWLRSRRSLPIAGTVLLAPSTALALFLAVKSVYRRKRPAGAQRQREKTYAFPSGHAAASAAVFGTLGYVLWREELLGSVPSGILATVPSLLIGASRVYLDVHWPTDVLGGWAVGGAVAAMSAAAYERVRTVTREQGRVLGTV